MGLQRDTGRAKQGHYQQYGVHAAVQHEKTTEQLVARVAMQLRKDLKGPCDVCGPNLVDTHQQQHHHDHNPKP